MTIQGLNLEHLKKNYKYSFFYSLKFTNYFFLFNSNIIHVNLSFKIVFNLFQVENDLSEINIYLIDGSLVDEEYFKTLDAQTTLILQKPGEALLTGIK